MSLILFNRTFLRLTIPSLNGESNILVVSYLCNLIDKVDEFEIKGEAGKAEFNSFPRSDISELNRPEFYKEGIAKAYHIKQRDIKNCIAEPLFKLPLSLPKSGIW